MAKIIPASPISVPDGITYDDIRLMTHTGRFIRNFSSQDKKAGHYRSGVMTKIGDIEEGEWTQYAETLIRRNGDEALFEKLKQWCRNTCPWLHNEKEVHFYSLECFVAGIHNNPAWVDYAAFNKQHRPELLEATF